ncbi:MULTISPECIES: hypothetical protein [Streptomyces]|uniref:hypothetical protein n=1 Tax=Streptomyces lycopersici TaxID=2974589 RepID=UPI0021D1CCF0|nr:hypothetical protein [Streptomyces sp. NEAU-383]
MDTEKRKKPLARRRVLALTGGSLIAAGCTQGERRPAAKTTSDPEAKTSADGPDGALGANFNEDPDSVTFGELRELSASWLRGFVPMPEVEDDASQQRAIAKLLDAHRLGHRTVLSLKFPYNHKPIPRPDSSAMDAELARVDKVLHTVLDTVDVLAIGNEPFIESLDQDRGSGALNAFYEHVAEHIIAYRKKHFGSRCRTHLHMGALNHLDKPDKRTRATDRWLSFTRRTPEIEGVDIHPHVSAPEKVKPYLDYILPRLRDDQKFLVTEFSLVQLWKLHLNDTIPARFARRYRLPSDTPVWKLIKEAIEHPFPEEKWRDFLSMSPWFENNKHFLRDQVSHFRDTGRLAVATYGVTQGAAMTRNFGPDKTPWLLNSLYANRTVERADDGSPAHNYGFFDDFRALQRPQDRPPKN